MTIPTGEVFDHLGVTRRPPGEEALGALLEAWSRRIPWESASRIARHTQPGYAADYARWPAEYLASAVARQTGGTCFESNYAFRALLDDLGYPSTFHFCDMDRSSTANPHCALIVSLNGTRFLADVGYPVPGALRLDPVRETEVETPVYVYHAEPLEGSRWRVRRTSGEFEQTCFTLKADPVEEMLFRARVVRDHASDGLFLDEVIIQKIIGDGMTRYSEGIGLVRRTLGRQDPVALTDAEWADLPGTLSGVFGMDVDVIRTALGR